MHVLIVGLGRIGSQLATNLVLMGHQVTGISRNPPAIAGVHSMAQSVQQLNLAQVPPIDWAYVILSPAGRTAASYQQVFIDSIVPLQQALAVHPLQRLVFISSSSVYGAGQGQCMDETTRAQPDTPTAQVLWQAEQQWQQAWGSQLTIVRPSGIYGPGRLRLIDWVKQGQPVQLNQWTNRIHSDDLTGFLAHLMTLQSPAPLYLATDQQPSLQHEVLAYLAQQLGVPALAQLAAPLTGKKLQNHGLSRSGYLLQYPTYQQGYGQILKFMQQSADQLLMQP